MEEAGSIVAIDANILVWGIRKAGNEEQVKRAGWLFAEFEQDQTQVMIPSVALTEYLTPVESDKRGEVIAVLSTRFIIPPFDVRCVSLAAKLFGDGRDTREMNVPDARKCLRADCLIIATAVVHGARTLYTEDSGCANLAKKLQQVRVEGLPSIAPDLFT